MEQYSAPTTETPVLPPPTRERPHRERVNQPPPPPKKGSRAWLWLLILALAGFAVWFFYFRGKSDGGANATAPATGAGGGRRGRGAGATPVVAIRATRGNIGVYLNGLGAVTPIYTDTIKSRVDGQLMKVYFKEGDYVKEGDPLVDLDPRPFQVALTQAEGQLLKDQATLDNARTDLKRYQTLLTQNAVPEQQLATQQATVKQYEGVVKTDQGMIDSAKLNIVYCHITAPITGRVGLRLVDPGNIVHASDSNGLLVITQMQPISVIFTISEDQLPEVYKRYRAGQHLRVDAYNREMTVKIATGYLRTIDNQIDQTTGTVRLRADFNNSDQALFPNQFVNARLLVEEKGGVTLLQTAAIQRNSNSTYVFLVKPDSSVTVRQVTTGTSEGDETEITSGLNPGDEIVMTGVDKLQEGSKVVAHIEGETGAPPTRRSKRGGGKAPAANTAAPNTSNPTQTAAPAGAAPGDAHQTGGPAK